MNHTEYRMMDKRREIITCYCRHACGLIHVSIRKHGNRSVSRSKEIVFVSYEQHGRDLNTNLLNRGELQLFNWDILHKPEVHLCYLRLVFKSPFCCSLRRNTKYIDEFCRKSSLKKLSLLLDSRLFRYYLVDIWFTCFHMLVLLLLIFQRLLFPSLWIGLYFNQCTLLYVLIILYDFQLSFPIFTFSAVLIIF